MTSAKETYELIIKMIQTADGYHSRVQTGNIVAADALIENGFMQDSREANQFFDDLNEEGWGFFETEKQEVYRLMRARA